MTRLSEADTQDEIGPASRAAHRRCLSDDHVAAGKRDAVGGGLRAARTVNRDVAGFGEKVFRGLEAEGL